MSVVDTALKYIGVPYVWGGSSPTGFDCSGLIQYSYAQNGVSIPRTAQTQYNQSTKISKSELQKGDLIFTSKQGSTNKINHVVMYIGDNKVIEAPYTGKNVRTRSLDSVNNIVGYGTYNTTKKTPTASALEGFKQSFSSMLQGDIFNDSKPLDVFGDSVSTVIEEKIPLETDFIPDSIEDKFRLIVFNIFKFIIIALLIVLFVVFVTKALDLNIL